MFTASLPKLKLDGLTPKVETDAPRDNEKLFELIGVEAVSMAVCAVLTTVVAAVKPALIAPAATVTDGGTVTAELLLARLAANPPLAAAAFKATVQLSVPAPVIEPLEHVRPVNTGRPVPLKLIAVDIPVDELLFTASVPMAAPAVIGSNCTVSAAV